jgi:hypothetical protein
LKCQELKQEYAQLNREGIELSLELERLATKPRLARLAKEQGLEMPAPNRVHYLHASTDYPIAGLPKTATEPAPTGQVVEARGEYQRATALLETMPAADVEQLIPPALERVESMIGYLVVEEPPQGAEVEIDGRSVVWEPKLPLNPGTHQLLVDHPDYEPFQGSITLGAGQTELVRLTLQRRETAPQKSAPTPTVATPADGGKPGSAQRVVFWTSVGVSGVGVGTGVVGVILFGGASSRGKELGRDVDEISGGGASACSSPNPAAPETCAELEKVGRQRRAGEAPPSRSPRA